MKKKDLIKFLDEIFLPLNFIRKGNNWVFNGREVNKIINLQKSNYGNFFYINYGFIIKSLEHTTRTHVDNRLASVNKDEQKRITDLLDLDIYIPDNQRLSALKKLIFDKIVFEIQKVNTEDNLLDELNKRPHLNNIPLVVKKHFNLQ